MTDLDRKRNYKYFIQRSGVETRITPKGKSGLIFALVIVLIFTLIVIFSAIDGGK